MLGCFLKDSSHLPLVLYLRVVGVVYATAQIPLDKQRQQAGRTRKT